MSKDLNFGRLSNSEKDVLFNIYGQYSFKKQPEINIKEINFVDFDGKHIAKSTLYKVLKKFV